MQEFIGLLGMDPKCSGGSTLPAVDSAEGRCNPSSCPCCLPGAASSVPGAISLQQRQKEETMAAAVEAVLQEIGEDPNREAWFPLYLFKSGSIHETILSMPYPSWTSVATSTQKGLSRSTASSSVKRQVTFTPN